MTGAPRGGFTADLRQLYGFMTPARRRNFYAVLALMLAGALAELVVIGSVVPFLSLLGGAGAQSSIPLVADLFDAIGAHGRDQQLVAASVLFMAGAVVAGAVRLQLAWSTQNFVLMFGHDLAVEIHRRTLAQPYSYHVSRNSSEIISSLEKVQVLTFAVLLQLMRAVTAGCIALFIIAALIRIDPFTAAVAAAAFGAIYALVSVFTRRRLARNSTAIGSAYQERVKIIQESLGGIRDVIIDNSQSVFLEEFRKTDLRLSQSRAATAFIGTAPRFVIEAAGMVIIAALALAISGREGSLSQALPILGAVALGALRLLPLMQQLHQAWATLAGNRSLIEQVLEMLRLEAEEPPGAAAIAPLPFQDRVRFEQVGFTYPGRSRPAIAGVSLEIPRGARLALVGPTGSGKSTLADLLMGLLEPDEGRITIDGTALGKTTRLAWQKCVAHVPQAIFLADASIARNIAFGMPVADIDMDRVIAAARLAQLNDFVASLPSGYDSPVGERGVRLSGGQRQRLGLARAIYKQAPVLVLDEATSALDQATEDAIMRALDELGREGRTIVIIAHRDSTVAGCDLVARLDNGRLADFGRFDQVLPAARARNTGTD